MGFSSGFFLAFDTIGLGSILCAKISNGKIRKSFVIGGALGMSVFNIFLLIVDYMPKTHCLGLSQFSVNLTGIINYILIFMIGFSAGFYSVTCYSELQLISPLGILSQVIGVTNILNALYMLLVSTVCTILLLFISLWWLFIIVITANLIFVCWYWQTNFVREHIILLSK